MTAQPLGVYTASPPVLPGGKIWKLSTGQRKDTPANALLCLHNVITCINYTLWFIVGNMAGCSDTPTGLKLHPLSSFPTASVLLSLLTKVHCYSTSVKLSKRGQLGSDKTSSCVMWKKWMWWCMKCNLCSNISETPVGNSLVLALIDMLSSLL